MTTSRQLSQLVPLPAGTGPFAWKPGTGWSSDFGSLFRIEHVQATSVGQTVFTIPNGYNLPLVLVWFNGALLIPSEYTATNGTSVTLGRGADATTDVLSVGVLYAVPTAGDALLTYTTATLPPAATNQAHIFWNSDLPGPVYSNGTSWLPLAGAGLGAVAVEDVVPISKGGTGANTLAGAQAALGIVANTTLKTCFAYLGANQTIPNNTWTKAAVNTLALGESSWLDTTNSRITPGVGTYLVVLRGYITACNDQDYASVSARKNGVEYFKGLSITQSYPSGADLNPLGVGLVALESASDYIELWFLTDNRNSGTRTLNNGMARTYIQVVKLS